MRVVDNAAQERYELHVGDAVAGTIVYRLGEDALTLLHTQIGGEFEGRGLGSRLVAGALADIRGRGLLLVPICPFVRSYLERHPEHSDVVAPRVAPNR